MPGGRPTKYRDDMPDQVREYAFGGYQERGHRLPTYEGLAEVLKVTVSTIKLWATEDDKAPFSASLSALKDRQRRILIESGLAGDYNATITKLMLSANHGMVERTAKELSGPDGGPVQVTEVKRTIVDS